MWLKENGKEHIYFYPAIIVIAPLKDIKIIKNTVQWNLADPVSCCKRTLPVPSVHKSVREAEGCWKYTSAHTQKKNSFIPGFL